MSKVSVVVPIYNAEKKLKKCINSIVNQSFTDLEIILVNDGSKDSSLDICRQYEKMDKRVIVINKENGGCILARRTGVERATSDYAMFVDADDWLDKNMIEILYSESTTNELDITVCNMYKVYGDLALFKRKNESWFFKDKIYNDTEIKSELATAYLHGHPFPPSLVAKLYKRDLLVNSGKYLERITFMGEDLYYNLEILLKSKKVKIIDQPFYYYRAGGTTSKYMPYLFDDMVNGYEIQKEVIEEHYQDTRERQYYGISLMLLNTFKTCLYNLFNSNLNDSEKMKLIDKYVSNENVIECLSNKGSIEHFPNEYLSAIQNKDLDYLFNLGQSMYKKRIPSKYLNKLLTAIS